MVADLLQAAHKERQRLESLLRSDPDFQKLEEVRRIIDLYEQEVQDPARVDPILCPDLQGSIPRTAPLPDQPAKTSRPAAHSDPPDRISSRRWTWGNSQSSRIRAATVEYLREKGKRARGGEIYKAIASKGVEVSSKKPVAVVCARLTASAIFDRTSEGYGLREWSDRSSPHNDGSIGVA